ncbi:immunity 49 family protein [Streptomyces coacervatus]|uniref:immunity 49 family protein n=1 Tax=Streptomyces coacervatus TaxID=647381 RepID=UPI0023DC2FFD|nr:immunity 49 family protein [Streptomyces coacervatus]MDF2269327.1 immunity 49 family protein [Streptomyces coacervatus]
MVISRHTLQRSDVAADVASLDRSVAWALEDLEEAPEAISDALQSALIRAETLCIEDPQAGQHETWEAWVTAVQAGCALFAAAEAVEGTVQARIAREVWTVPATGPQPHANAANWITTFWLCVVCREKERITKLCQVPTSLLRASGAEYDDYMYAWVEALQAYWLGRPDLSNKLVAAAQGTRPEAARIASPELLSKIVWPPIELLHQLLRQDHGQFNNALAEAVQWHRDYWTADEERSQLSSGVVALGPLAMACFAYDAGIRVTVESDYLPKALLERAWVGEFET